MTGDMPKSRNARQIPFAYMAQVREQIQEMLRDDILENLFLLRKPSYSSWKARKGDLNL